MLARYHKRLDKKLVAFEFDRFGVGPLKAILAIVVVRNHWEFG